jgi:hypothetical protein
LNTYSFYLVTSDGDRAAEPIEVRDCPSDAEALAEGCRALKDAPEFEAVEIWNETSSRPAGADDPCSPEYLGRWDRAFAG